MFHIKSNQRPISAIPGGPTWAVPSLQPTMSSTFPCRLAMLQNNFIGLYCRKREATVLTGKLKIMIFEEAVHEDDEFAHAGGHGDEGFLAGGAQAQIKLFGDAVVPHSPQGRHVEGAPHRRAAAVNAPDSILAATVAVGSGPIYTSTDSGVTWTAQNSVTAGWTSVASSADG